jgi:hypothetical protein
MEFSFSERQIALLSLCVGFALANTDDIEEVADEHIVDELRELEKLIEKRG